jgi:hypothetical protein
MMHKYYFRQIFKNLFYRITGNAYYPETAKEVQEATTAGTVCGGSVPDIDDILVN